MNSNDLYLLRQDYLSKYLPYQRVHYSEFNYEILNNIMYKVRSGRGQHKSYNDCFIMADTETSRKRVKDSRQTRRLPSGLIARECHVCAWTISIRAFHLNIVTLYGHKPSSLVSTLKKVHDSMNGDITIVYFHNMPYDYQFIRQFLFKQLGTPNKQLNIKSHYPLFMKFDCGIEIRDSLMLAQKKLEKWAADLKVDHQKAVGKWNYNKFRNQDHKFTNNELEYIEHDTLAGVECLDKTATALKKNIFSLPYTATGIIRQEVYEIGKANNAKELFLKLVPTFEQYLKLTKLFHGGFVHANRFYIDELIEALVQCFDFCSSYPFCMLAFKYPMEAFKPYEDCTIDDILQSSEDRAFMFKLIGYKVKLKDHDHVMPALQYSKCVKGTCINPVLDNGRILEADYFEIYLNEVDLEVIAEQYSFAGGHMCVEVETAAKDYLPRWFTDYVFSLFKDKCVLSLTDDYINYMVQKGKINSCYGMCVQKSIKEDIVEDYATGEYKINEPEDPILKVKAQKKEYNKYVKKQTSILLYQHGVWVTSYAFRNIHKLNKCVKPESEDGLLLYNDTDSGYAVNWDQEKIKQYNDWCLDLLHKNGYDSVKVEDQTFTLGIAEHKPLKDDYSEFKVMGAKRYAGRCCSDNEIHITVAGVPKKGAATLKNDLNNFTKDHKFKGKDTGKLQHIYFNSEEIYVDNNGNETGDSIDLLPCDYVLDATEKFEPENLFSEEIEVQSYEDI